jgi:outer membrane protein assembly factor BamB
MRALAACFSFAVLAVTLQGAALATDWPQFHLSVDRSGFNPEEHVISSSNVADLSVAWRATFSANVTSPVIADGRVYVGSNDGHVYALDAATGAVLWSGATGASIVFSPAVDQGRVFVGSDDTKIYAFPTTCATPCPPLWTATTMGRISSSPAVADGAVYVGAGRGADGDLWALDAATGATRWVAPLFAAPRTPAVVNGVVYTTALSLYAFPASCSTPCSPIWSGPDAGALPAVGAGAVYVDAGFINRFHAFPVSCATPCPPLWTAFTESNSVTAPAVGNGVVYNAEFNGALQAFPASCSTPCVPLWTVRPAGTRAAQNGNSSPAVANGVVYVALTIINEPATLFALDATTGATLATFEIGGGVPSSPAIVDAAVYVSSNGFFDGVLTKLDLGRDETPPVLSVPTDLTVEATGPAGATVVFSATATDDSDPNPVVTCTPPSGSIFPIGTTTVTCTATDASGNSATASFNVHVKSASEQLDDLLEQVVRGRLGPGGSLAAKLRAASAALNAGNQSDACGALGAFVNELRAQSGKTIGAAPAHALTIAANQIRIVLECR